MLAALASEAAAQYPTIAPPPACGATSSTGGKRRAAAADSGRSFSRPEVQYVLRDTADLRVASMLVRGVATRLERLDDLTTQGDRLGPQAGISVRAAPGAQTPGQSFILRGDVRRQRLRKYVFLDLVRATDDSSLWKAAFELPVRGWLAVEQGAARAVAATLKGALDPAESRRLLDSPTENSAAYEQYRQGEYYRRRENASDAPSAVAAYEAAAAADTNFREAAVGLALAYGALLDHGWRYGALAQDSMVARGLRALGRVGRRTASSEAWMARGTLLEFRFPRRLDEPRAAYERAIAADRTNGDAYTRLGRLYSRFGRSSPAEVMLRRARAIESAEATALIDLADLSFRRRRYTDACRLLNAAVETDRWAADAYALRALARTRLGEIRYAWADAETAARLGLTVAGPAAAAIVDTRARDTAAARVRLAKLRPPGDTGMVAALDGRFLASAFASAGQPDRALEVLGRIRQAGARLWIILQDPGLDPLRSRERFRQLVRANRPPAAAGTF